MWLSREDSQLRYDSMVRARMGEMPAHEARHRAARRHADVAARAQAWLKQLRQDAPAEFGGLLDRDLAPLADAVAAVLTAARR